MPENTGNVPPEDAVRRQTETILGSEEFSRSARGRDLLRYVVNQALEGHGDRISAVTIAQDVLGKGDDFDSGSDPLVRVQMGRLRGLLGSWYENHGDEAEICIEIPKGTYEPAFSSVAAAGAEATDDEAEAPTDGVPVGSVPDVTGTAPAPELRDEQAVAPAALRAERFWMRPGHAITGALVLSLVLIAAAAILSRTGVPGHRYPIVVVEPFQNLTGVEANDVLANGLQRQLASDLQRFKTVRVAVAGTDLAPAPAMARRRMARRARRPSPDYAVTGAVLSADNDLDFTLDLVDLDTNTLISRERYEGTAEGDYFDLVAKLSQSASGGIIGSGGAVGRAELARLEDAVVLPARGELSAFRCLSLFDNFVNFKTDESAKVAYDCLRASIDAHPEDSSLLGALAWTIATVSPDGGLMQAGPWARELTLRDALSLAERAVEIGPGDDAAHEYLGLIQWRLGQKQASIQSMRRAVALNAGNPHLLADLGLHLAFDGQWAEAQRLTDKAFARSGNPPGWYSLTDLFRAMLDGDAEEAQRLVAVASPGDPYGVIYELAAAVMAGDEETVRRVRPDVAAFAARNDGDALANVRLWIRSDEILDVLERNLAAVNIGTGPVSG